jgi:hypothetical protein
MYQYSRAIYMAIKDSVDPAPSTVTRDDAQRRLLTACEQTLERLSADPRYFSRPARSLFQEVRYLFPIRQQAHVYYAIERGIGLALEVIEEEMRRRDDSPPRCRATTRKGTPCQRAPLPERSYCASHQHLDEKIGTFAAA